MIIKATGARVQIMDENVALFSNLTSPLNTLPTGIAKLPIASCSLSALEKCGRYGGFHAHAFLEFAGGNSSAASESLKAFEPSPVLAETTYFGHPPLSTSCVNLVGGYILASERLVVEIEYANEKHDCNGIHPAT